MYLYKAKSVMQNMKLYDLQMNLVQRLCQGFDQDDFGTSSSDDDDALPPKAL